MRGTAQELALCACCGGGPFWCAVEPQIGPRCLDRSRLGAATVKVDPRADLLVERGKRIGPDRCAAFPEMSP